MITYPDTSQYTMDQFCHYPVFFECPRLEKEQKKRIENYFQIRRKSGGGDCGSIQTVNDQVYSIAFKDHAAQQRVLQQSEHVLEFPDGPLVLVVRGSLEPPSSSPVTTSPTNQLVGPKLSATTPAQQPSQQPILAPNLPQSSAEYELQLDTYLLRYLMDSPRAERELQEDLTSVACTAQLYPEEGRALVRRLQQTGAVADKQWQAEVDQIFDQVKERYSCHFELDPHKIKVLLLPCSSHKAIGEVMVYSMVGLAIVVGESSQVHARLREVEDLCLQRQGSSVVKKKMTRRLGEAKLRLLWKEIDQSLGGDVPGVKAMRGDGGQLVLEGSVEEIVKAGDWLTEKNNLVLQRNVSDFSPHLLVFLSKAHKGPGVLCDFLGIDGEVELEVGNIELRIFALSSDKLDETEIALRGKFMEVKVDVPDCPDVPTELKLKLESKAIQMNQGNCRPMVRFVSGGIVHLIGHTEEVEELNEIINQFILGQASSELHLPSPELAHCLPQLLDDCDLSEVTFHPEAITPHHTVVKVKGPSGRVDEVVTKVHRLLASTCQDEVLEDCNEDFGFMSAASAPDAARGATAGASRARVQIEFVEGFIETQQVDALVCPMMNCDPFSTRVGNTLRGVVGPGLCASFHRKAKEEMFPGDAVLVEDLPRLPTNSVFFLNLHPWDNSQDGTSVAILRQGFGSILASCDDRGIGSIAVPVVGTGAVLRFPYNVAASVLLKEVHAFEATCTSRNPFLVRFIIHPSDKESGKAFQSAQGASEPRDAVPDQELLTRRIVVLGKTGAGKSSLSNTIFGEYMFPTNSSANAGTGDCRAESRSVNGRRVTMIDTPGFFDPDRSDQDLKREIVKCVTECSPGPHAFLIVLKVDKFTVQEKEVIAKISQVFSEEAFKFATVVFTHGDQLDEQKTIQEFVNQNESLRDLVRKCGGRCHVIDSKHWNGSQENYRSNAFQVTKLLNSIEKMVMKNKGSCYTNEMLQVVEREIQQAEAHIRDSCDNMTPEEIRKEAKKVVFKRFLITLAGTATGAVLGAFLGVAAMVGVVIMAVRQTTAIGIQGAVGGGMIGAVTAGTVLAASTAVIATAGAVAGGAIGYNAIEAAETPGEAAEMAAKAVFCKAKDALERAMGTMKQ
ncbi:LOW QUALITY PROTEIN: uncharacterized protein LOC143010269 [Genypterus blacodes]|uniref:LOW QUALITY PROTEIN: uncharacterized protein LOC143010269 n=1 Tax=Genypterus blacodes TaxID=154954 RepID=UPI003F75F230